MLTETSQANEKEKRKKEKSCKLKKDTSESVWEMERERVFIYTVGVKENIDTHLCMEDTLRGHLEIRIILFMCSRSAIQSTIRVADYQIVLFTLQHWVLALYRAAAHLHFDMWHMTHTRSEVMPSYWRMKRKKEEKLDRKEKAPVDSCIWFIEYVPLILNNSSSMNRPLKIHVFNCAYCNGFCNSGYKNTNQWLALFMLLSFLFFSLSWRQVLW